MAVPQNIAKNWQLFAGVGAVLIAVGINLSELRALKAKQTEQEGRYTRQFELINKVSDRVNALEVKDAYRRGREDALAERNKTLSPTSIPLTP